MDGLKRKTITAADVRRMTPEQARALLRAVGSIAPCDLKPMAVFVRLALTEYAHGLQRG